MQPNRECAPRCSRAGTSIPAWSCNLRITCVRLSHDCDVLPAPVLRVVSVNGRPSFVRVRAAIAFNGRVREALDAYLSERVRLAHGVTAYRSQWRGLVQRGPAFQQRVPLPSRNSASFASIGQS